MLVLLVAKFFIMKSIGIIANLTKDLAIQVVTEVIEWLKNKDINPLITEECADALKIDQFRVVERNKIVHYSDCLIVFGGDGTLLNAARLPDADKVPILAVNMGSLGFLTEVALDELYPALEKVLDGDFSLDERMMLKVMLMAEDGKKLKSCSVALNDAVISKEPFSRIISLESYIDGEHVGIYSGDGIIIATPSGSTAYSLSAGGPIIHPGLNSFILTPLCSHTLTLRPLVVSAESRIKVVVKGVYSNVMLTIDGQEAFKLNPGSTIEIEKADETIKLIRSRKRNYYEVLRTKLKWGGS